MSSNESGRHAVVAGRVENASEARRSRGSPQTVSFYFSDVTTQFTHHIATRARR
jgi:hypothetical protein